MKRESKKPPKEVKTLETVTDIPEAEEGEEETVKDLSALAERVGDISIPQDTADDFYQEPTARELRRLSRKPDLSHLKPGVAALPNGDRVPLFDLGDRIVAERHTPLLAGTPWLDTRVYSVLEIDDETGEVKCLDEEKRHRSSIGYKCPNTKIFLVPKRGNPLAPKPKERVESKESKPVSRGRGRPMGSKNKKRQK